MKISTILDHIDSRHMALPEFQRGYVWNRDQVRGLFESLYRRHPVGGHVKFHEGLDFACDVGTPLYATGDGVVTNDTYGESGYGIHVDIDHGNGYQTKFAHMSVSKVKVGQRVTRGQLIGLSGNTGLSTGPHLHYEIMFNGTKIDPVDFFYMDLSPQEYRRLSLDPGKVTKEAIKKKLEAPSMD